MTDAELKAYAREQIATEFMKENCSTDKCDDNCADICDDYLNGVGCTLAYHFADQILSLKKPDGTRLLGIISDKQSIPSKKICLGCPDRFDGCLSNANFKRLIE